LGLYLGIYPQGATLNDFLRKEASLEEAIYTHFSGIKIIPASLELKDLVDINVEDLKTNLKRALWDFDIIFLDAAPAFGREALITLQASDEVIFVGTPHTPAIVDLVKCHQFLNGLEVKPLGVVLNRVRNKSYELGEEEVRELLGLPILGKVPEDENVLMSSNSKMPVVLFNENSPASQEFIRIAASLLGETYRKKERLIEKIKKILRLT